MTHWSFEANLVARQGIDLCRTGHFSVSRFGPLIANRSFRLIISNYTELKIFKKKEEFAMSEFQRKRNISKRWKENNTPAEGY